MTQTASNLSSLLKVRLAHVSDSEQNDPDCHPLLTVQGRICTSDSEQDDPDCFPLLYAHGNTYTSDSEQDDPVFGILFCANFSFSRMPWLPSSTRIPPTSSSSTLKMTLMWRQHRFWMYPCQCARGVCRCRVAHRMCSSPQSTCGSTSTCTGPSWPTSLLYRWGSGGLGFHFQRLLSPVISSFASYIVAWSGFETGVGISHGLIIICMHYVFGVTLEWWRVLAFVMEYFIPVFFSSFLSG